MQKQKAVLLKFELNKEEQLTALRVVKGVFGQQIVAKKDGNEVFLPHNVNLNNTIQNLGLNKLLSVTLTKKGNKNMRSEYDIHEITDQTTLM